MKYNYEKFIVFKRLMREAYSFYNILCTLSQKNRESRCRGTFLVLDNKFKNNPYYGI